MENKEELVLLDVRRPDEWEAGHLEGAIHIPLQELEKRMAELDQYRNGEIIVYCRSGSRSSQACMFLEMSGFANPVNLRGGLLDW
jgi:rhodanese-related sulfurtransferase